MKFKAYLFDFDGTLVDSMPTYGSLMLRILDENNIEYDNNMLKIITPLGFVGTAKYYRELGIKKSEEELIRIMNDYAYEKYKSTIPAKNNVEAVLGKLKESGASLNILTASPHLTLDACLERLDLTKYFTNVWSCEDFSTTKSDVNIYKKAAEKIGKPVDEILFLDDNFNAVKTAGMSGMKTCGVYDKSSEEYTNEIKSVCDYYIDDFLQLLKI